jgi:mitochondrial fission protein ELM1
MTLVWVLYAEGVGGRNQLEGLARHLGWPYEMKRLRFTKRSLIGRLIHWGPELLIGQSDSVNEPWPDLILVMSKEATLFALALRRKAGRNFKIVKIGRAIPMAAGVDLWIQSDQFLKLPWHATIAIGLPFHLVSWEALKRAADQFEDSVESLPQPRVALLIGGSTGIYELSAVVAERLASEVNRWVQSAGGSLLIVSSPRTGADTEKAIRKHIIVPNLSYYWREPKGPNPYMAFLALSDHIVVTEDSVSMIAEACATGKPIEIYALPRITRPFRRLISSDAFSRLFGFGKKAQLFNLLQKGRIRIFQADDALAPAFMGTNSTEIHDTYFPEDHRAAVLAIRNLMKPNDDDPSYHQVHS